MSSIEFDFPKDLSPFPRRSQDLLRMAHTLGWQMRWQGSNRHIVTLRSPIEQTRTINIPTTNLNADRDKSAMRIIARYSDPDAVEDYIDSQTTVRKQGSLRVALDLGPEPPRPKPAPVPETAVAAAMHEAEARAEDERIIRKNNDDEEYLSRTRYTDPQHRDGDPSVHLVSEVPWMVRKDGVAGGHGRMYESPAVLHRVWSDGTEDYRCRHCEYTNTNPRSVAVHAGKAKDHPKAGDPEIRAVEHYEQTEIKRPMSAIRRLTSDLLHVLDRLDDWQTMSTDELAKTLAQAVYDDRPDREPSAPLTPEQIIARITLLVDGGRLADLHQQVDRMAAALVESTDARNRLADEVIAEQRKVTALREERRALAAMLSDSESS